MTACRHCGKATDRRMSRGLCWGCYKDRTVRCQYPAKKFGRGPEPEPTEEELERMIEEQSRPENLPWWWDREVRRMHEERLGRAAVPVRPIE